MIAQPGRMDRRCLFERRAAPSEGEAALGAAYGAGWTALGTRWGMLAFGRGREAVAAGRIEATVPAVLTLRADAVTRGVTAADRVTVDGAVYAIRSAVEPPRSGLIEMVVTRGAQA